jgi:hypothetical protein
MWRFLPEKQDGTKQGQWTGVQTHVSSKQTNKIDVRKRAAKKTTCRSYYHEMVLTNREGIRSEDCIVTISKKVVATGQRWQ